MTTPHSMTGYVVNFLMDFIQLMPGWIFFVGCYLLAWQTREISWGHKWIGKVAVLVLFAGNILYTLQPEFAPKFRFYMNLVMDAWIYYNFWYFKKNPHVIDNLLKRPVGNNRPEYHPKTIITRRLVSRPRKKAYVFSRTFRWLAALVFIGVIVAYFIGRLANLAVMSDKRFASTTAHLEKRIQASEAKSEKSTRILSTAVDSLKTAVDTTNGKATTAFKKVSTLERKVDDNTVDLNNVNKKAMRADAKANRALNSPSFVPPTLKGKTTLPTNPNFHKGNSMGSTESSRDTLSYYSSWQMVRKE